MIKAKFENTGRVFKNAKSYRFAFFLKPLAGVLIFSAFAISELKGFPAVLAHQASAAMRCEQERASLGGTMLCENTHPGGTSSLLLRNIPPWNGHSGVTIVDVCSGKVENNFEPHDNCIRRYCTQGGRDLAVRVGPLLVPIVPAAGVVVFSFVHGKFEIICNAFKTVTR